MEVPLTGSVTFSQCFQFEVKNKRKILFLVQNLVALISAGHCLSSLTHLLIDCIKYSMKEKDAAEKENGVNNLPNSCILISGLLTRDCISTKNWIKLGLKFH